METALSNIYNITTMFVPVVFFIWRITTFLVAALAQRLVPYLGNFPYKELLPQFQLPSWLLAYANFDGIHYALIAQDGYKQYEQAFFPLYPLLIRAVSYAFPLLDSFAPRNNVLAGILISSVCFFFGLIFFYRLLHLQTMGLKKYAKWALLFFICFPGSFFFGAVYTEGLFFFLVMCSLYKLEKKEYVVAGIVAILASATRLAGALLIIPFVIHFLDIKKVFKRKMQFVTKPNLLLFLSPFIGLFLYCVYLWVYYKDPFFFINAQPAFNANRSSHIILLPQVYFRYVKILFTAQHNFVWYLSLFEMVVFSVFFFILIIDLTHLIRAKEKSLSSLRLGLNLFSFANIILPTLTGTFSSIPRYVLFSLSVFLFLGSVRSFWVKSAVIVLFAVGQIILLSLFIQGYFVA